jgi:hypothetical protein
MTTKRGLMILFVVFVMVLAVPKVKADDCVGIEDFGSEDCTGANGCTGSYELEYCSFGCISGECNGRGSSGECCGKKYYIPNISGDGGEGCSGVECGDARRRVHVRVAQINPERRAELMQGYTPGVMMLGADIGYKPAQLIYTFDRCSHSFGLLVEDGKLVALGGM